MIEIPFIWIVNVILIGGTVFGAVMISTRDSVLVIVGIFLLCASILILGIANGWVKLI